jgi:ubiquinone biosynthesis protein COQ4
MSTNEQMGERVPLPGPDDDVRPKMAMGPEAQRYFQGDKLPATSSALISNSKYLNDPYFREAFVTQALRRHGPDLPATYMVPIATRAMSEVTDYKRLAELVALEKKKFPAFGEWMDRRYFWNVQRDDLAKYPKGTLGAEIYTFMGLEGVDMQLGRGALSAESDLEYFLKGRHVHDVEHMISGFGPNTAGENALAMANVVATARFLTPELANLASMPFVWITSTGYARTALHYHHALPVYLDAMQQGIAAGLALRQPLFMFHWEDYLDWPLDTIAADLGFTRGPDKEWDWTTEAATG